MLELAGGTSREGLLPAFSILPTRWTFLERPAFFGFGDSLAVSTVPGKTATSLL